MFNSAKETDKDMAINFFSEKIEEMANTVSTAKLLKESLKENPLSKMDSKNLKDLEEKLRVDRAYYDQKKTVFEELQKTHEETKLENNRLLIEQKQFHSRADALQAALEEMTRQNDAVEKVKETLSGQLRKTLSELEVAQETEKAVREEMVSQKESLQNETASAKEESRRLADLLATAEKAKSKAEESLAAAEARIAAGEAEAKRRREERSEAKSAFKARLERKEREEKRLKGKLKAAELHVRSLEKEKRGLEEKLEAANAPRGRSLEDSRLLRFLSTREKESALFRYYDRNFSATAQGETSGGETPGGEAAGGRRARKGVRIPKPRTLRRSNSAQFVKSNYRLNH